VVGEASAEVVWSVVPGDGCRRAIFRRLGRAEARQQAGRPDLSQEEVHGGASEKLAGVPDLVGVVVGVAEDQVLGGGVVDSPGGEESDEA
jgi:hypothetical protein